MVLFIHNFKLQSVVPYTTSSNDGPEKYLEIKMQITAHAIREKPLHLLASLENFSGFHSQDEDITLRDFLLKSTAKVRL